MQFTEMQELALWKAIADAANERITTRPKGGANLRTEIDDSMIALYETTGADRVKLKLHEQEVGTLSLTFTKPKQGVEMRVTDTKKLVEWLRTTDEGADVLSTIICGIKLQEAIVNAATDYGFLPDGCAMVEVNEPKHYKGTMLKVDGLKVARAMAGELPSAVAGLLGMGEVE
ncbi:MAG: hypothetical protein ACLT5H_02185 [Collinsella stercoris]|uniref:hypothetical protein n=1 Tax=Collinsella stercoris TaxID=147206 RepID=UPI0039950FB5